MLWVSALSTATASASAVDEVCARIAQGSADSRPDLLCLFVSANLTADRKQLLDRMNERLPARTLLGCTGGGVIGSGREVEGAVALAAIAAWLPGVDLRPLRWEAGQALPDATGLREATVAGEAPAAVLLLAEPFSCPVDQLVGDLDRRWPGSPKVGGIASGGDGPGNNLLFLNDRVYGDGAVGVALTGDIEVATLVAQGCRPIGEPMFVTRVAGNVVQALDGNPLKLVLQRIFEGLDDADKRLFQRALFMGIVMQPDLQHYGPGDFLIRNLIGYDEATGYLTVGARLAVNDVVQFHLRDANTSRQDLDTLLARYRALNKPPAGALLFSCLGRGKQLYGVPDHDSALLSRHLGPVPLSGFFCNGEIGPVGGVTYVHGYTSSFALFRQPSASSAKPA